jgi:cellobiose phosphorylase
MLPPYLSCYIKFEYFDDSSREYIITRPDTPRPCNNYIGTADFGGVITYHAVGYTFHRSAAQGRLTRYKSNAIPADLNGRFGYLHDTADGDYSIPAPRKTTASLTSPKVGP